MKNRIAGIVLTLGMAGHASAAELLADVIHAGHRTTALQLIQGGADVNAPQGDGTTSLHWAIYQVDAPLTQALLAKGARPNVTNELGASPLGEAVKLGELGLVTMLLNAGAKANTANQDGQSLLMLAARTGSVSVAKALVQHGADVNAREGWHGQTALMWAAVGSQPEMVEYLISRHAAISVRASINDWGNQITSEPRAQYRPTGGLTPLLYAVRSGCQRCVAALLKAGADIGQPTPDGVTPLMSAIDNLHFDLAKDLLARGANPHVWDNWGRTALYVATDMNSLTSRGGGPTGEATDKTTALELMRLLLAAGVNPNPQLLMHRPGRGGNSGRFTDDLLTIGATPLLRAAISFDTAAMNVLLDGGALVNLPNGMGATPLMAAAGLGVSIRDPRGSFTTADVQTRSLAALEVLVKAGADVNVQLTDTTGRTARIARPSTMTDREGQTALYGPINWGWTSVVRYLLEHGARVDVSDAKGKTPVDAAAGNAGGRDYKKVEDVTNLIKQAAKG
jgi:ankyrin repeat protein